MTGPIVDLNISFGTEDTGAYAVCCIQAVYIQSPGNPCKVRPAGKTAGASNCGETIKDEREAAVASFKQYLELKGKWHRPPAAFTKGRRWHMR